MDVPSRERHEQPEGRSQDGPWYSSYFYSCADDRFGVRDTLRNEAKLNFE